MAHGNSTSQFSFTITKHVGQWLAAVLALSLFFGESARWRSVAASAPAATQTPPAAARNPGLAAAQRKLEEGATLQKQGTAEALRAAVIKYEEALALWRGGGDRYMEAITLDKLGETYDLLREKQKATDAFNAALKLLQTAGDHLGKANRLVYAGRILVKLRDLPNALDSFNQARLLFQNTGDTAGEAMTLSGIGSIHYRLGDANQALDSYGKSRDLWKSLRRHKEEAVSLSNIGALYVSLGERAKALDSYQQALSVFQSAGDRGGQSAARFEIGRIYFGDGQWKDALENLTEASKLARETGDRQKEAYALDLIGQSYFRSGQPSRANGFYKQALKLWSDLKNEVEEANMLDHLGLAYTSILRATRKAPAVPAPRTNPINLQAEIPIQQQDAIAAFDKALKLWRALGRHCNEADTLSYIGLVYDSTGDGKLAASQRNEAYRLRKEYKCSSNLLDADMTNKEKITIHERELARLRNERNRAGETDSLVRIGWLHHLEGDEPKAVQFTSEGQSIARKIGDKRREAGALNNLGMIYDASGQKQKAVESLENALKLFRKLNNSSEEANTLNNLGEFYRKMGSSEKALECYQQSLPISRKAKDPRREGISLNNIGLIHRTRGDWRKALDFYQQAVSLFHSAGAKDQEANTLENIGQIHMAQGDPQQALTHLKLAIPFRQETGDRYRLAYTLGNAGDVYFLLGELQEALGHYRRAQMLWNTLGKRRQEAATLNSIARLYDLLGGMQNALDSYERAAEIWRALGSTKAEATALGSIGRMYESLGDKQKAADYQNRAQALRPSRQASGDEESMLDKLSQEELASLKQTLTLLRSAGDSDGEARTLNRIGNLYFSAGETQRAIECYQQSLAIWRTKSNRREEAFTLNYLALAHQSLGEKQKVIGERAQASDLFRDAGDKRQEARSRSLLGDAYRLAGEQRQSLDSYRRSIALFQEVGERRDAIVPLEHTGSIHESLGEKQKALEAYLQARALWQEMGARIREAEMLNRIGGIYENSGEKAQAREHYKQARHLWQAAGDHAREASALYKLASIDRDLDNLNDARSEIEAAVGLIESVRTKVISNDLRSSYLAANHHYYELYIDLLMQLHKRRPAEGFNGLALQVSERARARTLLEILTEGGVDIRKGVKPELLDEQRALQQRLHASAAKQTDMLFGAPTQAEWASVEKEIEAAYAQLEKIESQIRQSSPNYAALTQPEPLTLSGIQQEVLDADTMLLQYALGDKQSYLWAVTQTAIASYELPGRAVIEAAAERVYALFTSPNGNPSGEPEKQRALCEVAAREQFPPAAIELSRMLLSPVAQQLGDKRLIIIADGALHKLPFNALPDPNTVLKASADPVATASSSRNRPVKKNRAGRLAPAPEERKPTWQPLVVKHEIVNLPSVSALAVLRRELAARKPAIKHLAVFADPVFSANDSRIKVRTQVVEKQASPPAANLEHEANARKLVQDSDGKPGVKRIKRLRFTRQEAEQILALAGDAGANLKALDFEASRQTAMSDQLGQYRYIHFATHGLADEKHPGLST
ncbi:MAG: tetratricopeptide repeat protein, partial [Blastocatellia bacterium]